MLEVNKSQTNGDVDSTTNTLQHHPSTSSSLSSGSSLVVGTEARLPWGAVKERQSYFLNHIPSLEQHPSDSIVEKKKPGEYVMQLVMLNFVQLTSKKFEQVISGDKKDKRLKESLLKMDDLQLDQLVQTIGNVAEQCLPSQVRFLLTWHEKQIQNLTHMKQMQQVQQAEQMNQASASKIPLKTRQQQLIQAKQLVLKFFCFCSSELND